MNKTIHFSGLNGIRALAAISVLVSHTLSDLSYFGLNHLGKSYNMASLGVTIFFTLSGFLITFLLLKEKDKSLSDKINIKHFYIRRVLRIWPLYFLYLFLCLIVYFIYNVEYKYETIFYYVFLLANIPLILSQTLPYLGHFWSIAVEEQFYLFWPWIAKINRSRLLKNTIILLIILLVIKYFFYFLDITYQISMPLTAITTTRFYCMIIGCIAGILFYSESKIIDYLSSIYFSIFCWLILFLAMINKFNISSSLVDHEIISIVTVSIILTQIKRENHLIDLDSKVFDFLGKISYGIYVYHPLILFLFTQYIGKFTEDIWYNYMFVFVAVFMLVIFVSYLSYNFFESKFIKMKDNFSSVKSRA